MLKKFWNDRSGNFAIIVALSGFTLISAVGTAVDLSNQMRVKTALQDAVDAATLAGAALAYEGKPQAIVKQAVKDVFNGQCPVMDCDPNLLSINLDSTKIEVASSGDTPTFFMGMIGKTELEVNAIARVNLGGTTEHIEVHMVLDNSASMNIVDGIAAINRMKPLFLPYNALEAGQQCAFACHVPVDNQGRDVTWGGKTGAQIARENRIPMREERIHTEMIDQARRLLTGGSNIEVGVYAFT